MFLSHNITFLLLFLHLLRLFDPLPGIGLPVFFLQSVRLAADGQLFVLSNLAASFCTSSSHLFLGFPAGLLPPDFLPEFVLGFCFPASLIHAHPTLMFQHVCTLPGRCIYTVSSSSLYRILQTPLTCNGPNTLRRIFISKKPNICAALQESDQHNITQTPIMAEYAYTITPFSHALLKLFVNYRHQTETRIIICARPPYCYLHLQTYISSTNCIFFPDLLPHVISLPQIKCRQCRSRLPSSCVRRDVFADNRKFKVGCSGVLQCHNVHAMFREYRSSVSKF